MKRNILILLLSNALGATALADSPSVKRELVVYAGDEEIIEVANRIDGLNKQLIALLVKRAAEKKEHGSPDLYIELMERFPFSLGYHSERCLLLHSFGEYPFESEAQKNDALKIVMRNLNAPSPILTNGFSFLLDNPAELSKVMGSVHAGQAIKSDVNIALMDLDAWVQASKISLIYFAQKKGTYEPKPLMPKGAGKETGNTPAPRE